jgi:hypothetical protein
MGRNRLIGLGVAMMLVCASETARAQEPEQTPPQRRSWSVAVRVGGFSDSSSAGWCGAHVKSWRHDPSPEISSGLDVSRLLGPRSGLTLSFDGMVFAGSAMIVAPMSLSYRYFPVGNGVFLNSATRPPPVQPWLGVGAGVYAFIVDDDQVVSSHAGGHVSTGLLIPLSRRFDVLGELRYAVASDARILSYTMGVGVRF